MKRSGFRVSGTVDDVLANELIQRAAREGGNPARVAANIRTILAAEIEKRNRKASPAPPAPPIENPHLNVTRKRSNKIAEDFLNNYRAEGGE